MVSAGRKRRGRQGTNGHACRLSGTANPHRINGLPLLVPLIALSYAAPLLALAQQAPTTPQDNAAATGLPLTEALRGTSATALQDTLYELVALKHKVHQMHWNLVGSDFYQLHEFSSEVYAGIDSFIDLTAERPRALGLLADARPSAVAENRSEILQEAPTEETYGVATTEQLLLAFEEFSARLYDRIGATSDDPVTQDFLIGIADTIEKFAWQIRAHTK